MRRSDWQWLNRWVLRDFFEEGSLMTFGSEFQRVGAVMKRALSSAQSGSLGSGYGGLYRSWEGFWIGFSGGWRASGAYYEFLMVNCREDCYSSPGGRWWKLEWGFLQLCWRRRQVKFLRWKKAVLIMCFICWLKEGVCPKMWGDVQAVELSLHNKNVLCQALVNFSTWESLLRNQLFIH